MAGTQLVILSLLWAATGSYSSETESSESKVAAAAHKYWLWKIEQYPTVAPIFDRGSSVNQDRLESYTLESMERRKIFAEDMLKDLDGVQPSDLSQDTEVTYDVLKADLSHFIDGYKFRNYGFLNPINFLEGIHVRTSWVNYQQMSSQTEVNAYMRRLQAVAKQVDEVIALMREAIRLNRTNHRVSMNNVVGELQDLYNMPVNVTRFYKPFRERQLSFTEAEWERIVQQGVDLIQNTIQPAYNRLANFLTNVYLNATRADYGVGSLEGGAEYYQACLRFHLTDDVTAEQIRDIGLREVARIKALLEEIMRREGFNGSLPAFYEYLRTNKKKEFYNRTQNQLLQTYRHMINDIINPKLPNILHNVPLPDVSVTPMPFDGPTGSYGGNTFYVNLRRPHTRPTFTMMALALHEANPGHHLQVAYARDQTLPEFRRHLCCMRYHAVPLSFQWYPAYTEGWGLYSEYLGEEMGCYNTSALELFGRYSFEIFRACRLVVDTGLHVFGWSRQKAIEYIANHTAISKTQVETEVDRYVTWPGQACAYKYGELAIQRLRRQAQEALGDSFDIRDFHDQILRVSRVPIRALEKHLHRWIARVKSAPRTDNAASVVSSGGHVTLAVTMALIPMSLFLQGHLQRVLCPGLL